MRCHVPHPFSCALTHSLTPPPSPSPPRFRSSQLQDNRESLLTSIRALDTALNVDTNEAVHSNAAKLDKLNLKKDPLTPPSSHAQRHVVENSGLRQLVERSVLFVEDVPEVTSFHVLHDDAQLRRGE